MIQSLSNKESKSREELDLTMCQHGSLKSNRILINPNSIRILQVQLVNSRLNHLMCDPIDSILSRSEIYYDLHHNIIETSFDGLK